MKFLAVVFSLMFLSTISFAALVDGIISYWKHDDATTSGTTSLDSLELHDGTIDGCATGGAGKINEMYSFTRSSEDNIVMGAADTLHPNYLTLTMWVYLDAKGAYSQSLIDTFRDTGGGTYSYILWADDGGSGLVKFHIRTPVTGWGVKASEIELPTGEWAFLAVTVDGSNIKWYENGFQVGADVPLIGTLFIGDHFNIGKQCEVTCAHYLDGDLDEVGLWNRALGADEIEDLWNSGDGLSYPFVADTCTAPGSGNWTIQCSDNCSWATVQNVPGNMYFVGSGTATLSAAFTFTGSNQMLEIGSGCMLEIASGGEFK